MNTAAIKKTEIIKQLSRVSERELDKIRMCIESVLMESSKVNQRRHSLKGIWKDKGFDRLTLQRNLAGWVCIWHRQAVENNGKWGDNLPNTDTRRR